MKRQFAEMERIDIELPGTLDFPCRIKLSATRKLTMYWIYLPDVDKHFAFGQANNDRVSHFKDNGTGTHYLSLGDATVIIDSLQGQLVDSFLYQSFPPTTRG